MKENPYHVLGLSEEATINQIKESYRELSKVFHPDKQRHEYYELSVQEFERIDQAYKILGNEFNKMVFDNFGHHGVELVIEHRHHFEKLEEEFHQGKINITQIHNELEILQIQEQELNTYSSLKYYQADISLKSTLFPSTNKNQYGTKITQIVELPRVADVEFSLRSECVCYQVDKQNLLQTSHFLNAATQFNLPFIGITGVHMGVRIKDKDFSFDQLQLSKQYGMFNVRASITQDELIPNIVFSKDDKEESFQIGLNPKSLTIISKQSQNTTINFFFIQNQIVTEIIHFIFKEAYYNSTVRLQIKAQSLSKQEFMVTNNFWIVYKNMRFDLITRYIPSNGMMQIQFGGRKINSHFHFPFDIKVESLGGLLFWMIIPHVIPYIWTKNWFNPWKKVEQKKRNRYAQKLVEYHKYNEEARENISQAENYQRYFQYENQNNGLIILEGYVGEYRDIKQLMRTGIANDFLVNVKEQLQAEVCDSGLFIPAHCLDKLDGFFKLESKMDSDKFWGYIRYSNGGKIEKKIWNYKEGISIGSVCGQKKSSIIEKILGYIYQ